MKTWPSGCAKMKKPAHTVLLLRQVGAAQNVDQSYFTKSFFIDDIVKVVNDVASMN